HGGISFGGVVAFIFADLIALPLVLIYRKYYGTKLSLRLFAVFGGIPKTRPHTIVTTHFSWNYTTFLNIAFFVLFALLYWLYRNRESLGGGAGYAIDPVCGMQVETAHAPAHASVGGRDYWFCSDRCCDRFTKENVS
ncbi:MAG: YHS domain-containing protein, partial [Actinobacteria bacterium]|nr:YHS domain-containing protein [Actinomycetota bacterium]